MREKGGRGWSEVLRGLRGKRGVYILILLLGADRRAVIGSLGWVDFPAGGYAYVGSAAGGLAGRLGRHLRCRPRRPHWHIDGLLALARPLGAVYAETGRALECLLAGSLSSCLRRIPRFGSTDCGCGGHLFHDGDPGIIWKRSMEAFRSLGLAPGLLVASDNPAQGASCVGPGSLPLS